MRNGFTIIETLIVIIMLGLLLLLATVTFSRFFSITKINQLKEDIITIIRDAKEKTMARENGYSYGVHLETSRVILFRAPAYIPNDPANKSYAIPNGFRITDISLQGGTPDIIFQSISGNANTSGTFVIEKINGGAPSSTIQIYATGIVEIK